MLSVFVHAVHLSAGTFSLQVEDEFGPMRYPVARYCHIVLAFYADDVFLLVMNNATVTEEVRKKWRKNYIRDEQGS